MLKPEIFYKAINQYCHHGDYTKILLAGIYLYCAKMPEAQKGLLREKFPEAQKDSLRAKLPEAQEDLLRVDFSKAQEDILQETSASLGEKDENTAKIIKYLEELI